MDIIDIFQEIREISSGGFDRQVVAKIVRLYVFVWILWINWPEMAEITAEASPEEIHEAVVRWGCNCFACFSKSLHDIVGVDLVSVENGEFEARDL